MQKRRLGQTEIDVSVLGLGTVKFGRNEGVKYPESFDLPQENDLKNLLSIARESGINLIDTAPAYGVSEERLGRLLSGARHEWIISTKAGEEFSQGESQFDFSADAIRKSIERSLKRLKTDYLDIVLIHSNGDDLRLIEEEAVFSTLSLLKREGKLRAFGMSTKTVEGGLRTIELADLAMVAFNPVYTDEKDVIRAANKQHKGILVKKAFASGHLEKLRVGASGSLQFILNEPGVSSIIIGTINPAHLKKNIEAI